MPRLGLAGALASPPCFHRARTGCIDSLQRWYPRCDSSCPLTAESHGQDAAVRIARGRTVVRAIDDACERGQEESALVAAHPDNSRGGLARPEGALQQKLSRTVFPRTVLPPYGSSPAPFFPGWFLPPPPPVPLVGQI